MNAFSKSALLVTGSLALAVTAFTQSTPSTNRPLPPESPRSTPPGAPEAPINPNPQAAPAATPVTPAAEQGAPAAEPVAAATPLRELNFAEADADGDKKVSLTEYSTYVGSRMATKSTETVSEEMIERFRQLDRDNDAFLSESEATASLQPAPQPAPAVPPRR